MKLLDERRCLGGLYRCALAVMLFVAVPSGAEITVGGDVGEVTPTDPTTWTSSTTAYIGINPGKVSILSADGGSTLDCYRAYVGHYSGSSGTVSIDGTGTTWDVYSGIVGYQGTGALNVTGGATLSGSGITIANYSIATGTLSVDGVGSSVTLNGLYVGFKGSGTLNVTNGGLLSTGNNTILADHVGSSAEATVSGAGSTWNVSRDLNIGYRGVATLRVEDRGQVSVGGATYLDRNSVGSTIIFDDGTLNTGQFYGDATKLRGNGTLTTHGWLIDGADMVFEGGSTSGQAVVSNAPNESITINLELDAPTDTGAGYVGTGSMIIANGTIIQGTTGHIGQNSGASGTMTVDGKGSAWLMSQRLYVGEFGEGTLNVTSGGVVEAESVSIAPEIGASGTVTLDGPGSTLTAEWLRVGYRGGGAVNVLNGAAINTDRGMASGYGGTANIQVRGAGATWNIAEDFEIGERGLSHVTIADGGAISVGGQTEIFNDELGSAITFDGGTLDTNTLYAAGTDLLGTGTIHTHGWIVDGTDVTFGNGSNSTSVVLGNGVDKNITMNLLFDGTGVVGAGYNDTGNLTIANGSAIASRYGYIGYNEDSDGTVTVNGPSSTWSTSDVLFVGWKGSGALNITGGGTVMSSGGYIGQIEDAFGAVTVDGEDSSWIITNNRSLMVGNHGSGTLSITNGGYVAAATASISYYNDTAGIVTVDGAGSELNLAGGMTLGTRGSGTLNITNGGVVRTGEERNRIGNGSGSGYGSSTVTVDGEGSRWISTAKYLEVGYYGPGILNISNGGHVSIAGTTYVDLNNRNNGSVIHFDGGTLETGYLRSRPEYLIGTGNLIAHGWIVDADAVFDSGTNVGRALLTDGVNQNITAQLIFDGSNPTGAGYAGIGSMTISHGSVVQGTYGSIGYLRGSSGTVTVDGAGSVWQNSDHLNVGYDGHGILNILNGAVVSCKSANLGRSTNGSGSVTVDGAGSLWTASGSLAVSRGELTITNGGQIHSESMGVNLGSTAIVDGANSTWTTDKNTSIEGGSSQAASLRIANGAAVFTGTDGRVSYYANGESDVTVTGAGSSWNIGNDLHIGTGGTGVLNINDGGVVTVGDETHIGSGGTINFDNGRLETGTLYAGGSALTGTGTVAVHGWIIDGADVRFDNGSNTTQTTITGSNPGITFELVFDGAGATGVGDTGTGSMVVSNGSQIQGNRGYIGHNAGSSGTATVDGADSRWDIDGYFYVGNNGAGTLDITNGGSVSTSNTTYIAFGTDATGTVNVNGNDSTWDSYSLFVGRSGAGQLNITNGGTALVTGSTFLADQRNSTAAVAVSGSDASLQTNGSLFVGYNGNATLSITDGGTVTSGYSIATIGHHYYSESTVTVEGAMSSWLVDSDLHVGYYGQGILNIRDGGMVTVNGETFVNDRQNNSYIAMDGGVLKTDNLVATASDLRGNGTVTTHGWIIDGADAVFDQGTNTTQVVVDDGAGQNITMNLIFDGQGDTGAGASGAGSMAVSNGSVVRGVFGYVGHNPTGQGTVTIDGEGAAWILNANCTIGRQGEGEMIITNGGKASANGESRFGDQANSVGAVTVDGINSLFSSKRWMYVGNQGEGTLDISNGATVSTDESGYVGYLSASHGQVNVDGAGSSWVSAGQIGVGRDGTGVMSVTNGGAVICGTSGYIGFGTKGSGSVTIDGVGSRWQVGQFMEVGDDGPGTLCISNGGLVTVGRSTIINRYGKGGVLHLDGGTLQTVGLTANAADLHGNGSISLKGWVVDGTDLVLDSGLTSSQVLLNDHSNQNINLNVSFDGSDVVGAGYYHTGSLTIANGSAASSTDGIIGFDEDAVGVVTVDGAGSTWHIDKNLNVGQYGTGTLNIINGGAVHVEQYASIASYNSNAVGHVTVDGAGSLWTIGKNLNIGSQGTASLTIANDGLVSVGGTTNVDINNRNNATVVFAGGSLETVNLISRTDALTGTGVLTTHGWIVDDNRELLVNSGTNTAQLHLNNGVDQNVTMNFVFDGTGTIGAGYTNEGSLTISNGSKISGIDGTIGYKHGATGTVTVTGHDSEWVSTGHLNVGSSGTGILNINDGGRVHAKSLYINSQSQVQLNGGTLELDTIHESTIVSKEFYGVAGLGRFVTHSWMFDRDVVFDASNTVRDLDNPFSASTDLDVTLDVVLDGKGFSGVGCTGQASMSIINGAVVEGTRGYIGYQAGSRGTVIVNGHGTQWNHSDTLFVGYEGSGTLHINNGAAVSSHGDSQIGSSANAVGTVTVEGNGATWTNVNLEVGFGGQGSLNILASGSVVTEGYARIDGNSSSVVNVSGPQSSWAIGNTLHVGYELNINNGGKVISAGAYIGSYYYHSSTVGTVDVDGNGSTWDIDGDLTVGRNSVLNIRNGGRVTMSSYRAYSSSVVNLDHGMLGIVDVNLSEAANLPLFNITGTGKVEMYTWAFDEDATFNSGQKPAVFQTQRTMNDGNISFQIAFDGRGDVSIGHDAEAHVIVSNGTAIKCSSGYIGYNEDSIGDLTVTGAGTSWESRYSLHVGHKGNGTMRILHGAAVSTAADSHIGAYNDFRFGASGNGLVKVEGAGSTWVTGQTLHVGRYSYRYPIPHPYFPNSDNGVLEILDGGSVIADTVYVRNLLRMDEGNLTAGQIINYGTIEGTGSITCANLTNTNILAPGQSPGTLIIDGDLVLDENGTLRIDILGTSPGEFDILHITGDLTLNGTIEYRLLHGMSVSIIEQTPWLSVDGNISGAFTNRVITHVPEPMTIALLGGLVLLSTRRRAA